MTEIEENAILFSDNLIKGSLLAYHFQIIIFALQCLSTWVTAAGYLHHPH